MNRAWAPQSKGFTIVELLIVVVVIAILASLTLVAYNGISRQANVAAASTSVRSVGKALELYKIDHANAYPATLADAGIKTSGTTYQYTYSNTPGATAFCVTGSIGNISVYLTDESQDGSVTEGACDGHSSGTPPTITNLVTNPGAEVNTAGWAFYSGTGPGTASLTRTTADQHTGSAAISIAWSVGSTSLSGCGWFLTINNVSPSTEYTGSLWVKSSINQVLLARADIRQTDTWQALSLGSSTTVPANQWTRLTVGPFTTQATSNRVTLCASTPGSGSLWSAGDVLLVDSAMLTQGAAIQSYGDGNNPNWVWNGALNASTSTGPAP